MSKLSTLLKGIAPALAAGATGPLKGMVTQVIAKKFLGSADAAHQGLESILESVIDSPEKLAELKQLDQQFKQDMAKLEIDVFSLEVDDRKSARELASNNIKPQIYMSVVFLLFYFSFLASLFYVAVFTTYGKTPGQESLWSELQIFMGLLTAGVGQILSFWFGGSKKQLE